MKKILPFLCCIMCVQLFAQEPADALRFSWTVPSGTARQQAIGGAMTSLGGDITATFINPAGLGFYKTGDFVVSPLYRSVNNKAAYYNHTEKRKENNINLGATGFVLGSGTQGNKKSVAFSIAMNRTADFNSTLLYRGENNQSSFSQKFLEEIQNDNNKDANSVASDFPFGISLAFNTFWIDTIAGGTSGNYQFQSRAQKLLSTGLLQENSMQSRGGITEFALGGALNFNDKLMLGGSLGLPLLNYERDAEFTEADATSNAGNNFDFATFTEGLTTKGIGFNARAGLIYKPQEFWRLGFAIHSPTFYNLTDNYEASITADTEGYQGEQTQSSTFLTNGEPSEFKYILVTPYRVMGSVSYVLREIQDVTKQKGFITADVEYVNYKASSFEQDDEVDNDPTTDDYLQSLNRAIDNAYKGAFNVKLGGELKFTTIMVRAGAAYYGNPYKNINGEKGNKLNLSGGLGYRNKGLFVDLTYVHAMNKDVHFPYRLESAPYAGANIKSTVVNILMTVGFKF